MFIKNNLLTIFFTGDYFDYISGNSFTEYVLEINHSGKPERVREVRLENIVIGDGFGGTIDNLDDFSNSGVPGEWYEYRY